MARCKLGSWGQGDGRSAQAQATVSPNVPLRRRWRQVMLPLRQGKWIMHANGPAGSVAWGWTGAADLLEWPMGSACPAELAAAAPRPQLQEVLRCPLGSTRYPIPGDRL